MGDNCGRDRFLINKFLLAPDKRQAGGLGDYLQTLDKCGQSHAGHLCVRTVCWLQKVMFACGTCAPGAQSSNTTNDILAI